MDKYAIIRKVFSMLERQKFADWYNTGKFNDYITGDLKHETGKSDAECREEIEKDLDRLLGL